MIVVPSVDAFMDPFRERPSGYTIEELTVLEQCASANSGNYVVVIDRDGASADVEMACWFLDDCNEPRMTDAVSDNAEH